MTHRLPSRRDFLQHGSAALAGSCALTTLAQNAWSLEATSASLAKAGQQAICCTRREAANAARDVLEQGGNAVDAAVAAVLVQCVIEPSKVGIGGYASSFVMYNAKTGRVHAIDADARAPRKLDTTTLTEKTSRIGYLAIGVPGIPAGIDLALRDFGSLPFRKLAEPAIGLAENGTLITPAVARTLNSLSKNIDPVSRRAYFPNDVPQQGTPWIQKDLGRLLRQLADDGPTSFYRGDIPRAIVAQVQANGGLLTEEDFHEFEATTVEPLRIDYRGHAIYTPPLPSGGLTSLTVLKTLEQFDLAKFKPWSAPYYELFIAALNLAWHERDKYLGDPDFVSVPVDELLSEKHAIDEAKAIRAGLPAASPTPEDNSHTINVTVVDKNKNVVSWTATHGDDYGSHVAIEGLGLMLGHGMSRFDLIESHANRPEPGKRPVHNMSPIVMLKNGKPYATIGMPGGTRIVSVTAQIAISLMDFKASPQQAVSAPRIHCEGGDPVKVNADMPAAVIDELRKAGHTVELMQPLGGDANAIVINQSTGAVTAAASRDSTGVLTF
jgi:gamma-glutamyltranspeptidase/glutathione hydrolase